MSIICLASSEACGDALHYSLSYLSIYLLIIKNSRGVIHRDIKLSNCILSDRGHVKLCDFGCAKVLFEIADCHGPFSPRKNYDFCPRAYTYIGTLPFMAPEVQKLSKQGKGISNKVVDDTNTGNIEETGGGYCFPADWYALGVVFFELLTGCHKPCLSYNSIESLLSYENNYNKTLYDDLMISDFITRLLHVDAKSRLGYWQTNEVLSHPIFVDRRKTTLEVDWTAARTGMSAAPNTQFDRSVGHFEIMQLFLPIEEVKGDNEGTRLSAVEQSKFEGF